MLQTLQFRCLASRIEYPTECPNCWKDQSRLLIARRYFSQMRLLIGLP